MRRFFVAPENVGERTIIIDDKNDLHHMIDVLRLSEGDAIEISDGREWEYVAELINISKDAAEAVISDKQRFASEPDVEISLFQSIPKQSKMESIVQKTVELGVSRIIPMFTARTVVTDNGNFQKKIQRWRRVSCEAVKQCRRGTIPEVEDPVTTEEAAQRFHDFDMVIFPYENETGTTIKDVLRRVSASVDGMEGGYKIAVLIGPEGGFSNEEADAIVKAGANAVSLGKRVLRTETAGPAAVAMIMYELEL